jgi:hypothetical protein
LCSRDSSSRTRRATWPPIDVARGLDANTMSLQYLEALKVLGSSDSTKFVIPMEFSSLLLA